MNVLSIQSHVAYGHVGNRSAVFPLERLGISVWPVNTVQFSSNSGKPGWKGRVYPAGDIVDVMGGIESLGVLGDCAAVLSGYVGDAATGSAILAAVDAVKRANPSAVYCCDPVMGDIPEGFYVRPDIPGFMRCQAVPRADIVIPNHFEAEALSGLSVGSAPEAARAAEAIRGTGPRIVVITSYTEPGDDRVGFYLSCDEGNWRLLTPRLPFAKSIKGSGDLFSALFLGRWLASGDARPALELAAASLYGILRATAAAGLDELAIVQAQEAIAGPVVEFRAEPAD